MGRSFTARGLSSRPDSPAYKRYLLVVLMSAFAYNLLDRAILGLVIQDVKTDLGLTDTQVGFLGGIAFAFFYSILGLPIARWADRGNRVTILSATAALFAGMLALCGMAASFVQLLLIRIGVAVGEAGCVPPAHSLIADTFSRVERPRAVAIFQLGSPLSFIIGSFGGGWLVQWYGWRTTFVILGLPGLLLAGLMLFTLVEPRVAAKSQVATSTTTQPGYIETLASLWRRPAFRHLLLCLSVLYFFGYGLMTWQPAFLIRSFGLSTGEVGTWFALLYGFGGLAGTYAGGWLADRFGRGNERLQLACMACATASFGLFSVGIYLASNVASALMFMGLGAVGLGLINGPLFAITQSIVPANMRATAVAVIYLCANLIGMGLGPLVVGIISDQLAPSLGNEALRYALLIFAPGYIWAGVHLLLARRTAAHEIALVEAAR